MVEERYASDVQAILARRHDNGGDLWAAPDGRLIKGSPFTTLESACLLKELGVDAPEPVLQDTAALIFGAQRADGRFRLSPDGAIYPCHTANAARTLCHLGYADDPRLQKTFEHLLSIRHSDGGWKCLKYSFGRGPETEASNPGPTLTALDAFRFTSYLNHSAELDRAVAFLLAHWQTRLPLGPCHYGIGTLFMQAAYPFGGYNLFFYVHALSFYDRAKDDPRFREAFKALSGKLVDGQMVAERVVPKLAALEFCKKGRPSELATRRYREILANLGEA